MLIMEKSVLKDKVQLPTYAEIVILDLPVTSHFVITVALCNT